MTASAAPIASVGRVGTRLVIRRESGQDVVDLEHLASVEEEGKRLRLRDDFGNTATLDLDAEGARADILSRVAEWCAPVLEPQQRRLLETGIELRSDEPPLGRELAALTAELGGAALVALLARHWVVTLAAGIYGFLRTAVRLRRASALPPPIRLVPARDGRFARLVEGRRSLDLAYSTFDVAEWFEGRAVMSDGTQGIRIPIGERPGAFLLFATLVALCGTPEDRIVD